MGRKIFGVGEVRSIGGDGRKTGTTAELHGTMHRRARCELNIEIFYGVAGPCCQGSLDQDAWRQPSQSAFKCSGISVQVASE